jgi:hypothetical protein
MPYKDKARLYEAQKRHRIKIRAKLLEFLLEKCCVDCGEKDPVVLDFDHRDGRTKFKIIGKMLSGHYSWKSVHSEIQKCDIRCANCHRRKTYREQKSWGRGSPL